MRESKLPEGLTDATPFLMAVTFALYALHDQLVEAAHLAPGQLSATLRRFRSHPDDAESTAAAAIMYQMADELERNTFGAAGSGVRLEVIAGGARPDGRAEGGKIHRE